MKLKLSIKTPSEFSSALAARVLVRVDKAASLALPKLATLLVDRLSQEADRELHTTAQAYKQGIQTEIGKGSLAVRLVGALPNALEKGFNAFDIKAKMLATAHKFGKYGPYVDVSLGQRLRGTKGVPGDVRTAMTAAVSEAQSQLRKAGASKEEVATATVRLKQHTPGKGFTRKLLFGSKVVEQKVQHKRGIYDDLLRTAVMGEKKAIGSYQTIRRISAKSDPSSWWHPGFKGVHLFDKVGSKLRDVALEILKDSMRRR